LLWKELVEREEAKPWLDEQARQGSSTPGSRTDAGVLILQAAEPFDLLSAKQTKKMRPGETKSERKSLHTRQLKKFARHSAQPACMREQAASVHSAMQIPASVQKNSAAKGFERWTSSLSPQIAYHSDYEELLYRRHPQSYLGPVWHGSNSGWSCSTPELQVELTLS